MLACNPVTGEPGSCIAVGRGAIAIRLALSDVSAGGGKVILPANICYAAVLPVLYAGLEPVFCDVDALSGNATTAAVAAAVTADTVAAIIPHMYGNPVRELPEIAALLQARGIPLIEDCASLMARDGAAYVPGMVGDYVVYSTGYSKTIDIGMGGLLFSRGHDLAVQEETEKSFPAYRPEYEQIWSTFSKTYRSLRNEGQDTERAKAVYARLPESFRASFAFAADPLFKKKILSSIDALDEVIRERRRQCALYRALLDLPAEKAYAFAPDAVPWRFNLFAGEERAALIRFCLERRLPISDWYPSVVPIFPCGGSFPGAEEHEKKILNFPLMISDEQIGEICGAVRAFYAR